jgi:hypothetical protein
MPEAPNSKPSRVPETDAEEALVATVLGAVSASPHV